MVYYRRVVAADVRAFLGQPEEGGAVAQIDAVITVAKAMVNGYTRGRGFDPATGDPDDNLAAVITSCAARLYRNPTLDRQQAAGPFSQSPGVFNGWTLPELAILHNYRERAR